MPVIYQIKNTTTQKTYIGSTKEFASRKARHLRDLRANKHHNIHLQRSFNKYGENVFEFSVLEECTLDNQFELEAIWIANNNPEYNIGSVGGGDNLTNNPNRDNIIQKIKDTVNANLSKMSEQDKKDKWGKKGADNPNWRGGVSIFTCPSCGTSRVNQGQKTCNTCRDRHGENNPFYGKKHSEEAKEKISKARKEQIASGKLPSNARKISCEGLVYNSIAEGARTIGITSGALHYRINSTAKKWKEYFYINA